MKDHFCYVCTWEKQFSHKKCSDKDGLDVSQTEFYHNSCIMSIISPVGINILADNIFRGKIWENMKGEIDTVNVTRNSYKTKYENEKKTKNPLT